MNCPNCGSVMVEFRSVERESGLEKILDRCEKCGGEWLGVNRSPEYAAGAVINNFPTKKKVSLKEALNDDGRQVYLLLVAGFIMLPVWLIPGAKVFLYPLSLIGTWFHEFGHGLAAFLVGGFMTNMQISGLSGMTHFILPFNSNWRHVFVAAGGPLMPSILGSLLIMSGRNSFLAKLACRILAIAMIATVIISVPSPSIGMVLIFLIALLIMKVSANLDAKVLQLFVHILGIQAVISTINTFDYLSRPDTSQYGGSLTSDTGLIEKYTGMPTIMWAIIITVVALTLMLFAFLFSFKIIFNKKRS